MKQQGCNREQLQLFYSLLKNTTLFKVIKEQFPYFNHFPLEKKLQRVTKLMKNGSIYRSEIKNNTVYYCKETVVIIIYGQIEVQDQKYKKGEFVEILQKEIRFNSKSTLLCFGSVQLWQQLKVTNAYHMKKLAFKKAFSIIQSDLKQRSENMLIDGMHLIENKGLNSIIGPKKEVYILFEGLFTVIKKQTLEDIAILNETYFAEQMLWSEVPDFYLRCKTSYNKIFTIDIQYFKYAIKCDLEIIAKLKFCFYQRWQNRSNLAKKAKIIKEKYAYKKNIKSKSQPKQRINISHNYDNNLLLLHQNNKLNYNIQRLKVTLGYVPKSALISKPKLSQRSRIESYSKDISFERYMQAKYDRVMQMSSSQQYRVKKHKELSKEYNNHTISYDFDYIRQGEHQTFRKLDYRYKKQYNSLAKMQKIFKMKKLTSSQHRNF